MSHASLAPMLFSRAAPVTLTPATWLALAPQDEARGEWRVLRISDMNGDDAAVDVQGTLEVVSRRIAPGAALAVVVPLMRCIVMAVDLPPLTGVKLQQALAGILSDRLIGTGSMQHYAAAPVDNGRIREAAACDAQWLRKRLDELAAAGLHVAQVIPEASLLPKGALWWGQWHAGQEPAWLVRAANGEAVRIAAALLEAVLHGEQDAAAWQWFADPANVAPPALPDSGCSALGTAALLRGGVAAAAHWDLRQFDFAPPDASARFMNWCAGVVRQRSGRFALAAILALLAVNLLGLNLYALKQQRAIEARHGEMERIVKQALPDAPRLLEPALQLEAAWQRARGGAGPAGAATLLGLFAQTGSAQGLTALDIAERSLRATYADAAALERAWAACQGASLGASLQRAGVRCAREGTRLMLDLAREPTAAVPLSESPPC